MSENKEVMSENNEEEVVIQDIGGDVKSYKCDTCGSMMVYSPDEKKLRCESCGNGRELTQLLAALELSFDGEFKDSQKDLLIQFDCSSCGAVVSMDNTTAKLCPFCGASAIVEGNSSDVHPNAVLPFRINKENAMTSFRKWIKSKWFAPTKFKKTFKTDKMHGVYIPCWTFDCVAAGTYEGRLGKRYVTTIGVGKNRRTVTRVRYYRVSGNINRAFDDVLVEDSSHVNASQIDKIGGFDTQDAVAYETALIAGFTAEKYDKGRDVCFEESKSIIKKIVHNDIVSNYNADIVDYLNVNIDYYSPTYKYVLCPIWITGTSYRSKKYGAVISGRSAKIVGKMPLSILKVALASVLGAAVAAGFGYFIYLMVAG